jgi:hypothetical protein
MSGREFTKVSPAVWASKRFHALTERGRLLYFYCLTSPHVTSCGVYRLPDAYAASDLGWSVDEYRRERDALIAGGLVDFDTETSEVLIERWFRHNAPMNPDHATGTRRLVASIDSDRLREAAEYAFTAADEKRVALQEAKAAARRERKAANDGVTALENTVGKSTAERLAGTRYMSGGRG